MKIYNISKALHNRRVCVSVCAVTPAVPNLGLSTLSTLASFLALFVVRVATVLEVLDYSLAL